MKLVKIAVALVLVVLIAVVLLAPIGPLPGFFIGGKDTPVPTSWPDTSAVHEIKLKVPGTLPRVVIIWVIEYEGELYIVGNADSGWVKMIGNGSPVALRLGDETFSLNASKVDSGWQPVMEDYVAKYKPDYPEIVSSFPSPEEAQGRISVFKLSRS